MTLSCDLLLTIVSCLIGVLKCVEWWTNFFPHLIDVCWIFASGGVLTTHNCLGNRIIEWTTLLYKSIWFINFYFLFQVHSCTKTSVRWAFRWWRYFVFGHCSHWMVLGACVEWWQTSFPIWAQFVRNSCQWWCTDHTTFVNILMHDLCVVCL